MTKDLDLENPVSKDTIVWSRKKLEVIEKSMYEEADDSGRGERD